MSQPFLSAQRIAIGVFTEAGRLGGAIEDLGSGALRNVVVSIIGASARVRCLVTRLSAALPEHLLLQFADRFEVVGELPDGGDIVAATTGPQRLDERNLRLQPDLISDIEDDIDRGAVVLLVEPGNPDELTAAIRVLLRHSSHRVRASEIVPSIGASIGAGDVKPGP
ncbi:MAG: hypothetical protein R3D68_16545 [Hyphomicrobiaceae bacterium]